MLRIGFVESELDLRVGGSTITFAPPGGERRAGRVFEEINRPWRLVDASTMPLPTE